MSDSAEFTSLPHRGRPVLATTGLFILLASLASGLLFSCRVFGSYTAGIFSRPGLEPVQFKSFSGLDCPTILNRQETGTVRTRIENESGEEKVFLIDLAAQTQSQAVPLILSGSTVEAWWALESSARRVSGTLAAGEVRRDSWQVRLPEGGEAKDVAIVAYIDDGNSLYWGSCGLAFTALPGITGGQMRALILGGIPLGTLLWLFGRSRMGYLVFGGAAMIMILWIMIIVILW